MIYDYVDVNEQQTNTYLPAEAVSINGLYLENAIEGYRTLYVGGRESLGAELNTYSVGTADGERIKGSRYPSRTLTVGFQLLCDSDTAFRQAFNQLNNILSQETADFVFRDEPNVFFTGKAIMDAEIEAGRNNVTGEWHIYCAYPFKRSTNVRVLSSDDESGVTIDGNVAVFNFNYNGSMPSKPLLRVSFASALEGGDYNEDGDCGYVAFYDKYGHIIQLGNPEVIDLDQSNKNETVINSVFDNLTGWTASGISVGAITDPHWNRGAGQTQNYARGIGTLRRSISNTVNFEYDIVQRLCVNGGGETGSFKALLQNNGRTVVGYTIDKIGAGTSAQVKYILMDTVVGYDTIDIGYYNENFGYCKKIPIYVTTLVAVTSGSWADGFKGWFEPRETWVGDFYTQSNLNSGISRDNDTVTFSIGNLPARTFKMSALEGIAANEAVFETTGNMNTNAVRSAALIKKAGVSFAEIPNVFTAGDVVVADCSSANVYLYRNGGLDGHLEPQYGALGNDWEEFSLNPGENIIACSWSDWVDENYRPKIEILFNEVYL